MLCPPMLSNLPFLLHLQLEEIGIQFPPFIFLLWQLIFRFKDKG